MASRVRDWARLPMELLQMIAARLPEIFDYARFRCVCAHWRSAAPPSDLTAPQLPLLFPPYLPTTQHSSYRFFTLSAAAHRLHLPDFGAMSMRGSSRGWLLALRKSSPYASLLNPLTHAQIRLPRFPALASPDGSWSVNLRRIIWPSQSAWVAVIQFTGSSDLFFCRTGDTAWKNMNMIPLSDDAFTGNYEVIYHGGRFFVTSSTGSTVTVVIDAATLARISVIPRDWYSDRNHLVESSSGKLLLVSKTYELRGSKHVNHGFEVSQLHDGGEPRWLRVRSIRDEVLFVDFFNALSLSSAGFSGLRRNCIYFVEGKVVSVFNLEDGREEELLCLDENPRQRWGTTYAWMMPSLQ